MMKVDSWLHLPKGEFDAKGIRAKLTLTGHVSELAPTAESVLVELYRETDTHILVPRQSGFLPQHLISSAVDCTLDGERRDFGEPIKLRPGQIPLVDKVLYEVIHNFPYGGQLIAAAGSGKTVMGLEVVRQWGRTTLILVHKEFLMNQWKDRIKQFLPKARVGIVQQNTCQFGDDYDIVIAMIQSLSQRRYLDDFYKWPGVVVSDETHRLGAETWHPVITQFSSKLRFGLTATPRRKDRMEPVFFWHIGPVLAHADRKNTATMVPFVKQVYWRERYDMGRYALWNGKFNMSKWITDIGKTHGRNRLIAKFLVRALIEGRKVIALSDRLDHLDAISSLIHSAGCDVTQDYYVGGRTKEQLEKAAEAQLVFATYQMAAEALDIPDLDCLFLMTPKSDVEQAVGRIQRMFEGKKRPIVIDIIDSSIGIGIGLARSREQVYARIGATVR